MEKVKINIQGMSCGHCVKSVTGLLKAVPGVTNVDVSLEGNAAEVSFDPSKTSLKELTEVVNQSGVYKAVS